MLLKRIHLRNFKRLADFQAEFSPGINVVKGSLNEIGKATLLEGIVAALFHNPKSAAKELKSYVSWGSSGQCQTSLEFEDNDNKYLLEKDFHKGTIRLTDENTREELGTFKEISKKMTELLGTNSDGLFTCTSCIRQSQVSQVLSGEKEISESLEEVITGGEEGTLASHVIQKLDSKISEIRKGLDRPARIKGSLASLRDQQREYLRKCDDVRGEVSRVEVQKTELVEVNEQLAQVKEQYENARALLDKNKKRKEIEESIERLARDYGSVEGLLARIRKQEEDFEKAAEALQTIEGFEDKQRASEFRRVLDAVRNRRGDIEDDLAMRERELAGAKGNLNVRKSIRFFGSGVGIATAIIVLTGGAIGTLVGPLYLLSLIILGAALLFIAIKASRALVREKTTISVVEGRIQDMKDALSKLGSEEQELLANAKCNSVTEFNKKEKDAYNWRQMKERAENRLDGMLGGNTIQDIEKQRTEVSRKLAVEGEKLTDDLKETRLSPEEYIELERKVQNLDAKQTELEAQKRRCEVIIEQARFSIEDQIRMEEELESLEEVLRQEEKKVKVYGLARDFVSKAKDDALSSITDILKERIQEYFDIFTNGKYKQIEVKKSDKEALDFWIYSDEKEDWARPEELSGGVIDEFYLAFRLSLAGLIFGDKKPPLILDDPFVNFDSVRLANTLNCFENLASDYQIIIFTLGDLYDHVADNIILLGEKGKPL